MTALASKKISTIFCHALTSFSIGVSSGFLAYVIPYFLIENSPLMSFLGIKEHLWYLILIGFLFLSRLFGAIVTLVFAPISDYLYSHNLNILKWILLVSGMGSFLLFFIFFHFTVLGVSIPKEFRIASLVTIMFLLAFFVSVNTAINNPMPNRLSNLGFDFGAINSYSSLAFFGGLLVAGGSFFIKDYLQDFLINNNMQQFTTINSFYGLVAIIISTVSFANFWMIRNLQSEINQWQKQIEKPSFRMYRFKDYQRFIKNGSFSQTAFINDFFIFFCYGFFACSSALFVTEAFALPERFVLISTPVANIATMLGIIGVIFLESKKMLHSSSSKDDLKIIAKSYFLLAVICLLSYFLTLNFIDSPSLLMGLFFAAFGISYGVLAVYPNKLFNRITEQNGGINASQIQSLRSFANNVGGALGFLLSAVIQILLGPYRGYTLCFTSLLFFIAALYITKMVFKKDNLL